MSPRSGEAQSPFDNDWEEFLQDLGLHWLLSAPLTATDVQLEQERTSNQPSTESNFLFDNDWDGLLQDLASFRDPNAQNVVPLTSVNLVRNRWINRRKQGGLDWRGML